MKSRHCIKYPNPTISDDTILKCSIIYKCIQYRSASDL